jgi:hypothetical protein
MFPFGGEVVASADEVTSLSSKGKKVPPPLPPPEEKVGGFPLETFEGHKGQSPDEMRKKIAAALPGFRLAETPLDDAEARRLAASWQEHLRETEVAILHCHPKGKELLFLENVAAAVTSLLRPAKVVDATRFEKENKWSLLMRSAPLKLICAPPLSMWRWPSLLPLYREIPNQQLKAIGEVPLLLLDPTSLYLSEPERKRHLWDTLCQLLKSP